MYDAIVVGARCAGSPTAMLLARKGYKVLLVDRATFPSDIMSTHYIHQAGMARLKRWGLLDRVVATGAPPIDEIMLDLGPFALTGTPPAADGVTAAYCPRRRLLDKVLVDAAVESGAELREGFSVQELTFDGDRVTGLRGKSADGRMVTEEAKLVIGADGIHSFVARAVQAPITLERPATNCCYYSYWSGTGVERVEWYPRPGIHAIALPTNDGLVCFGSELPLARFESWRNDIEGTLYSVFEEAAPPLYEKLRLGKREERFTGTADIPNFFRKPYGPGWALAGDAGYHKDPITGEGISDAFRGADLLAEAVDAGLAGRQPLDEALADYERQRDEASMPVFDLTCLIGTLEPLPEDFQQLFGALAGNQPDTNRMLGLIAGTTSFAEFFAPENVGRIMAEAQQRAVAV